MPSLKATRSSTTSAPALSITVTPMRSHTTDSSSRNRPRRTRPNTSAKSPSPTARMRSRTWKDTSTPLEQDHDDGQRHAHDVEEGPQTAVHGRAARVLQHAHGRLDDLEAHPVQR